MRFKVILPFLLLIIFFSTNAYCAEGNLQWVEYSKALQVAKEKDKPVLLYFYRDGCPYCKILSEQYFTDRDIGRMMKEGFVLTKLDGTMNKDIALEFGVSGVPTVWLLSKTGERILKIPGLADMTEFKDLLDYAGKGWYKKMDVRTYLKRKVKNEL
jgi:thioredoxin-related protein